MVVPMFAPRIRPTDSRTVSIPAFTRLTTMTVTTELDCSRAVSDVPDTIPLPVLRVRDPSTRRNCGPAIHRMPSLMSRIPNRNRPKPPSRVRMKCSGCTGGRK